MLSENIYQYRRMHGLSQEQLADKIGVSRQTISKWEGGQSTPDVERLVLLADCFGISVDTLIRGGTMDAQEEKTDPQPRNSVDPITIFGVVICILGLLCMMLLCVMQVLQPSALENLNMSSMVTFSGTGIVFGFCMLAVVIGIIMVLRRK